MGIFFKYKNNNYIKMKYQELTNCLIIFCLINVTKLAGIKDLEDITFKEEEDNIRVTGSSSYRIHATFNKKNNLNKYLYMYPENYLDEESRVKTAFKIYFKKFIDSDLNYNYLESNYSTIDYNSGLFINIGELDFEEANIFIIGNDAFSCLFYFQITDAISFPKYYLYSNFQMNQFILPKSKEITVVFGKPHNRNDYLMVFSKTSLRNFDVIVKYNNDDITYKNGGFFFPNGYSLFYDKSALNINKEKLNFKITNKNNKDEIIVLGYIHLYPDGQFPNPIYNGFHLYLQGNINTLRYLENSATSGQYQYFTYQSYSINNKFVFVRSSDNTDDKIFQVKSYNSAFNYNVDCSDKIRFDFTSVKNSTSLYFQYLDYTKNQITQKLIQPLVSGSPKSILLPDSKSLYHFLPKTKGSENINYYLRSKDTETKFVSFRSCTNYPDECFFEGKGEDELIVPFINNIGLWYSQPIKNIKELPLIYIFCKNQCSYDIIMTYDDDPLFLFPDNNYIKFIGKYGKDSFILPVFEDLGKTESLKIDVTVLSGKGYPKLTLYGGIRNFTTIHYPEVYERTISYNISKSIFQNNYKKDIYAVLEGEDNILYNIMYAGAESKNKLLDKNRIINENITVPKLGEESNSMKIYSFNNSDSSLYISVSTQRCESKVVVVVNNQEKTSTQGFVHNFKEETQGIINIKIYLINNGDICKEGFEDKVNIFAYSSTNKDILIGENNLVNSSLALNELTFTHLFKPKDMENDDNSYIIEIEKLTGSFLTFSYNLVKLVYNLPNNDSSIPSFKKENIIVKERKNIIINNTFLNKTFNDLNDNEIFSLTMKVSSPDKSNFSLFLNKNDRKFVRTLTDKTLISSINSKSIQYFCIDLNKNYDTEIIINSFEQDLQISTLSYSSNTKLNEEKSLPSKFNSIPNYYHFVQPKITNCKTFCKLYIAVKVKEDSLSAQVDPHKTFYSTFSINYLVRESEESSYIYLPMNYYSQYSFKNSGFTAINYYLKTAQSNKYNLELKVIKENENDNSVVFAEVYKNGQKEIFDSLSGSLLIENNDGDVKIKVYSSENEKPNYKLKISDIGDYNYHVTPILSSYSEKCNSQLCFFTLDIGDDNHANYAYLFVPELEDINISIKKLNSEEQIGTYLTPNAKYDIDSNTKIKGKNSLEYEIGEKNIILLIRLSLPKEEETNLYVSFNSKPNLVTLNYGEKRMFSIENPYLNETKEITFNITKPTSSNNKYKICFHAVKGNGIINFQKESFALGLASSYKEKMSIIIDNDSKNLLLTTNNKLNDEKGSLFSFTVDYIINPIDQFFYEIKPNKINSFKFNSDKRLEKLTFYMKVGNNNFKDISMNIKIYTSKSKVDLKSYIVDEDFIESKKNNSKYELFNSTVGVFHTFVDGGSSDNGAFTFSKLDISSEEFVPYAQINEESPLYIYLEFTQKNPSNNKIKIDLYPYEMLYSQGISEPLSNNELFVQKWPLDATNYPLLLTKSEFDPQLNIKIDFIFPITEKYKLEINNYDLNKQALSPLTANDNNLIISEKYENGKYTIILDSSATPNLFYMLFNIKLENEAEPKNDSFIFKYGYENQEIYHDYEVSENFTVGLEKNKAKFEILVPKPKYKAGETVLIVNGYNLSDIPEKISENYASIYLLFSDIKPIFSIHSIIDYSISDYKNFTTDNIKKGSYYFTCVGVIQDNERVDYVGYIPVNYYLDKNDDDGLLDYIKDHVIGSIIILIIILIVLGIGVNIFRTEKKGKKEESTKKVELILEDKNIN